jgi:hypothetical protein
MTGVATGGAYFRSARPAVRLQGMYAIRVSPETQPIIDRIRP